MVSANLGPYNLPNCGLDFISDILNLGLNSKSSAKDTSGITKEAFSETNCFPLLPIISQYPMILALLPTEDPRVFQPNAKSDTPEFLK